MRAIIYGICAGLIAIAMLAGNAGAQMGGCSEGCMMGGMERGGMMQGMGGMHGHKDGMMEGGNPMLMHLMSLGLDDKQQEAIKALHSRTMKEMAKKGAEKEIAEIELQDLLAKDTVDVKAVEAAAKKKAAVKTEMFMLHIRAHEEMKSLLTPEQRKKLKEMMAGGGMGCSMMGGMKHGEGMHEDMPMHEHVHEAEFRGKHLQSPLLKDGKGFFTLDSHIATLSDMVR